MAAYKAYTPEALTKAARKYFRSISRQCVVKNELTGEELLNYYGRTVPYTHWLLPPTETGLCRALKISRETLRRYKRSEEYREATEEIESVLLEYNERQLLTREGKDLRGVIFNLQNNFGHTERREVELGERAARSVAAVPLSERAEQLRELARIFIKAESDE